MEAGKKTVILGAAAMTVLADLDAVGAFVIRKLVVVASSVVGEDPRPEVKEAWLER